MSTIITRYVLRPGYYLSNWVTLFVMVVISFGGLGVAMATGNLLWLLCLSSGILLFPVALGGTDYDPDEDPIRQAYYADRLTDLFTTTGPVPATALAMRYRQHHRRKLPDDIFESLLASPHYKHVFREEGHMVGLARDADRFGEIPAPRDGNYELGYYRAMARLHAIREHPELATVQDSLIDDLYGLGV